MDPRPGISSSVRRGLRIIGRHRRRHLLGLGGLAVFVAGIEVVAAFTIFAIIEMLSGSEGTPSLPMLGELAFLSGESGRSWFLGLAALFFVSRGFLSIVQKYVQSRFAESVGRDVSVQLFSSYLAMPYQRHLQRSSSELIRNGLWSVNDMVNGLILPAALLFSEGVVALALVIALLATSPLGILVAAGIVAPLAGLSLRLVRPQLLRLGGEAQRQTEVSHRLFFQPLEGIRDVKILGKEEAFAGQYRDARGVLARARYLAAALQDVPRMILETTIFLILIAALFLLQDGSAPLAVLGIFGYAVLRLLPGLNRMVGAVNRMRFGRAATDHVYSDLFSDVEHGADRSSASQSSVVEFQRSIEFDSVSFVYDEERRSGVHDLTFSIKKGDFVGVAGATGAGKTTMMDLLAGLLAPTTGTIRIDDDSLAGAEKAWRTKIALVPQNVFLLDDTLRGNIALGASDKDIDDEEVWRAIEAAQLGDFVADLPQGLDTRVGERGVRVSGGQRQRVAIARAIYTNPEVLMLDEGTASLDTVTEQALLQSLARLRSRYTIVSIAHRLASIKECDQILVMHGGRLVDQGSFDDLVVRSDIFRRMAD